MEPSTPPPRRQSQQFMTPEQYDEEGHIVTKQELKKLKRLLVSTPELAKKTYHMRRMIIERKRNWYITSLGYKLSIAIIIILYILWYYYSNDTIAPRLDDGRDALFYTKNITELSIELEKRSENVPVHDNNGIDVCSYRIFQMATNQRVINLKDQKPDANILWILWKKGLCPTIFSDTSMALLRAHFGRNLQQSDVNSVIRYAFMFSNIPPTPVVSDIAFTEYTNDFGAGSRSFSSTRPFTLILRDISRNEINVTLYGNPQRYSCVIYDVSNRIWNQVKPEALFSLKRSVHGYDWTTRVVITWDSNEDGQVDITFASETKKL
jgi:hypothetical protein